MITPIPLLTVPVVNRGDLLLRLFESTNNYPIEKIVIINNGNNTGVSAAIDKLKQKYKNNLDVIEPIDSLGEFQPKEDKKKRVNWGCSKSWNYVLKTYLMENDDVNYSFIASNDVAFNPGEIEKVVSWMKKDKEENLGNLGTINFAGVGYGFFFVNKTLIENVGYFDENFYPAYYEDMDYNYRIKLINENDNNNVSMRDIPGVKMMHGNPNSKMDPNTIIDYESCTIHSEEEMKHCNDITFWINLRYYMLKWGGDRGKEIWKTPYGRTENPINYWEINPTHRNETDIWNQIIFKYGDKR